MGDEQVYRFFSGHCQGKKNRGRWLPTALCPDNGALPALRSLLSVALSSIRVQRFYHATLFPPRSVFRCENGRFFVVIF